MDGRRIAVRGTVQGVGFRPWVYRQARARGLAGHVCNDASGVVIEAFGTPAALDAFVDDLRHPAPPAARVDGLSWRPVPPAEVPDFRIVASAGAGERRMPIPPDIATCAACAAEIADPANRRAGYAFTNCTDCGPRFSIARDIPYDRATTTMAGFVQCPACAREYGDVEDRRFHAQPNACPVCGPQLRLRTAMGEPMPGDPLTTVTQALLQGRIAAVKGLGGYHLACDATDEAAVRRLRARKHRDAKPFAVMVPDLATAERLARLDDAERRVLQSAEAPIVLVRARRDGSLAPSVAPDNPLVGLMLPYTPLHHLLLHAVGRPLVMTSGNRTDEPMVTVDAEVRARLGAIVDLVLAHDRPIENRIDDSVVRVVDGAPVVSRRARGWVPRPVAIPGRFRRPVLACGAHLKNTCCLGVNGEAYLGPHAGDLETPEAVDAFVHAVERMERFLDVRPAVIAHDLHPEYASTAYARRRAGATAIAVQHHHAHVVAVMAEHGIAGPVLGVAFDGTGYGTDGTAWGGEILQVTAAAYTRIATCRPIALPGGDRAVRAPWRTALAALHDAFDGAPPLETVPLFRDLDGHAVDLVRQMLARGINTPYARGVGRYFDAAAALGLGRATSRYEGEAALAWNWAFDPAETGAYAVDIDRTRAPWELDARPLWRGLVGDVQAAASPGAMSARFHRGLAHATATALRAATCETGIRVVAFAGGCFQNAELAALLRAELPADVTVLQSRLVPPGDGGLALGQAVIADAVAEEGPCA